MTEGPIERCALEAGRLADRVLSAPADGAAFARLLESMQGWIERELAGGRAAAQPEPACAPGCAACCTVNVATPAVR